MHCTHIHYKHMHCVFLQYPQGVVVIFTMSSDTNTRLYFKVLVTITVSCCKTTRPGRQSCHFFHDQRGGGLDSTSDTGKAQPAEFTSLTSAVFGTEIQSRQQAAGGNDFKKFGQFITS